MRHSTLGVIVLTATVLPCVAARADFTGLVAVREFPNQMTSGGLRDVFRVYAEFTNPTDRVDTWYGTEANPFLIQNVLVNGSPGSGFFRHSFGSLPPEIPGTPNDWNTWATIGTTWENEMNQGSFLGAFSLPPFRNGNQITSSVGSIFLTSPAAPDGLGNFRISGADTALRTLVMQLTVMPGEQVQGMINLGGRIDTGAGYASFTALSQTFTSVPSPATMALFIAVCGRGILVRRRI